MNGFLELAAIAKERLFKGGAFLVTGKSEKNPTTVGWVEFGRLWNMPIVTIYVRPTRYAHGLIERDGLFTLSFPKDDAMKNALNYCGVNSGRDVDKRAKLNIDTLPCKNGGIEGLKGNFVQFECKVAGKVEFNSKGAYIREDIKERFYNPDKEEGEDGNLHTVYYGEVLAAYETE